MGTTTATGIAEAVEQAVAALDFEEVHRRYWEQNEFLYLPEFLPRAMVEELLVPQAQSVKADLNRNYIPGHKKGGSVSYYTVSEKAPRFVELYRSDTFLNFLCKLTDATLMRCPDNDPHACALYYYTEAGDHIGFHYDTSYYKGARYTTLMGLLDRSAQCRLVCELYKDDPKRAAQRMELATAPGDLIVFNGEKLWHAVTPLGEQEERIVLTMEYVTNPEMGPFKRLFSNLKDSFAYFGVRTVFKRAFSIASATKTRET